MSRPQFTSTLHLANGLDLITGTADPTAGGGVAAAIGSLYMRATTGQLWLKTGAGNTAWTLLVQQPSTLALGDSWYGTGLDGSLHFDGAATVNGYAGMSLVPAANVYTLSRSIVALDMTVDAGVTINANGFKVFVLNTLTLNGKISWNGGNGGNAVGNAAGAAGAATTSANSLIGGSNGGAGGGAGSGASNSGAPTTTHFGATLGNLAGGAGGAAGNAFTGQPGTNGGILQGGSGGGGGGAGGAGGVGGGSGFLPTPNAANEDHFWTLTQAIQTKNNNNVKIGTGSGGGGGGGGATATGGGGGGAGSSAGCLLVAARILAGNGSVECKGGNGGDGATHGGSGGGGAGGVMVIFTDSNFGAVTVTFSVAGGNPGVAAPAGGTGGTGGSGLIYKFNPKT